MFLIWFAWTLNFTWIAPVIMILHDVGDMLLYFTKVFKYLQMNKAFMYSVVFFFVVFVVTRLALYGRVMYSTIVSEHRTTVCPAYVVIFIMMLVLYGLNCYWTTLCFLLIYVGIKNRNLEDQQDIRSDDSSAEASTDESEKITNGKPSADRNNFIYKNQNGFEREKD